MRISINVKTINEPFGGANNFAKNLSIGFRNKGFYVTNKLERNLDIIIIIVSHDSLRLVSFSPEDVKAYKRAFPNVCVIHRINSCDEHRAYNNGTNERVAKANKIADHTVFVSKFIKLFWQEKGLTQNNSSVIHTRANKKIFNPSNRKKWDFKKPIKIVTHHWSSNYMKGFDIYQRLDEMLVIKKWKNKIKFTFIGNTPLGYDLKNSQTLKPLKDLSLSKVLKNHHIYLTASRYEAAGNHYIEALQCGLPILHLNHGSIPEYCSEFGVTFDLHNFEKKLEEIISKYDLFFKKLSKCNFNEDDMINTYCKLIKKLTSNRVKKIENRIYLFYLYKVLKFFKILKTRIGLKIVGKGS